MSVNNANDIKPRSLEFLMHGVPAGSFTFYNTQARIFFTPYYPFDDRNHGRQWRGLVNGVDGAPNMDYYYNAHNEFWVVEKPKEKVVRWLWAHKSGAFTDIMYSDSELAEAKIAPNIKLEWSRTEFPE